MIFPVTTAQNIYFLISFWNLSSGWLQLLSVRKTETLQSWLFNGYNLTLSSKELKFIRKEKIRVMKCCWVWYKLLSIGYVLLLLKWIYRYYSPIISKCQTFRTYIPVKDIPLKSQNTSCYSKQHRAETLELVQST